MRLLRKVLGTWWGALILLAVMSGSVTAAIAFRSAIPFGTAASWSSATGGDPNAVRGPWFDTNGHSYSHTSNNVDWEVDEIFYSVRAFGACGDNTCDDTAAVQAAVNAAEAAHGGTVFFPCANGGGEYKITGTITMHQGTKLKGCGTQGSTVTFGSVISHAANNTNLFVWDGNGASSAAGTGGGAEDLFIVKALTFSGGDAIFITSTDDNHRPGEMVFRNILVGAENNSALWSRAFHLDGSANTTAGTRGIRSIRFDKVRLNACDGTNFPNKCLHLTQVTHLFADHLEVDPVGGDGAIGMTLDGNFDDIFISSMEINGSVVIAAPSDGAYLPNVFMRGRAGTALTVNATTLVGQAEVIATSVTNLSNSFNVISTGTSSYFGGTLLNFGLATIKGTTFPAGNTFIVQDNVGNQNFVVTDNGAITVKPGAATGSALGLVVNSLSAWTLSDKLISAKVQNAEKFFVRGDGLVFASLIFQTVAGGGLDTNGAGTLNVANSSATALALAKAGVITTIKGGLVASQGFSPSYRSASSTVTVATTDHFVGVSGSGARTVNLPAASTCNAAGQQFVIQEVGGSAGAITINRAGSDTINGGTSIALVGAYEQAIFVCDGTSAWFTDPIGASSGAAAGTWAPEEVGTSAVSTNFIRPYQTVANTPKMRNVACSWTVAGTLGTTGVVAQVVDTSNGNAELCNCTLGACTTTALTPLVCDCNSAAITAGHAYAFRLKSTSDCSTFPQNVACSVELTQ